MNILVLELLGYNVAYLGCYGNEWVATPNLDRLAAEGVVFDQHFVEAPIPRFEPAQRHEIDASDELPAMVKRAAKATGVVWITGPRLAPPWTAESCITDYAEDNEREPWFETAIRVTPDDLPSVADTYAGVVTYLDAQLGAVLERLDDWTIVVTAANGLSLEELVTDGPGIGEEAVHLPLIVRFADRRHAGERTSALTGPSDLHATLRSLLGLPATVGRDLMPLLLGEAESLRPDIVSLGRDGLSAALRTSEWALVRPLDAATRLYVRPDDRWEVNDVAQHHREVVESLEAQLRGRMTPPGETS